MNFNNDSNLEHMASDKNCWGFSNIPPLAVYPTAKCIVNNNGEDKPPSEIYFLKHVTEEEAEELRMKEARSLMPEEPLVSSDGHHEQELVDKNIVCSNLTTMTTSTTSTTTSSTNSVKRRIPRRGDRTPSTFLVPRALLEAKSDLKEIFECLYDRHQERREQIKANHKLEQEEKLKQQQQQQARQEAVVSPRQAVALEPRDESVQSTKKKTCLVSSGYFC